MKKSDIVYEIERKVVTCSNWRIGLTHEPEERKTYWAETKRLDVKDWLQWETDSLTDAQEIENYFINKGMRGGTGGDLPTNKTIYVYIF